MFPTCFKACGFILRKTGCTSSMVCFTCNGVSSLVGGLVFEARAHYSTRQTTHTNARKAYHTACTTCLPKDEPTKFKSCRKHQNLNINLESYAFCWFVLHNYITMPGIKGGV